MIDCGNLSAHKIQLESVSIGNGWYDPLIQYAAYYNYSVNPGNTYDITFPRESQNHKMYNGMYGEGNCYDMTVECRTTGRDDICSLADAFCYAEVEYVWDQSTGRDEYDVRELDPNRFPYTYFEDYLNLPEVQQAIGAFVNYTSNNIVNSAFAVTGDDDRGVGAVKDCRKLVDQGIYVFQYNGDAGRFSPQYNLALR